MGSLSPTTSIIFVSALMALEALIVVVSGGNFTEDFDVTWGGIGRAKIVDGGKIITLSLDKESGSGFESKNKYLFGNIHMQLKLVPGNSAGTVTTFYLWSNGSRCDEIDFGFFGNLSGDTYVLQTNVVTQGLGNREQQFSLWFDPTAQFHTYSILWNPQRIVFAVDGTPIRLFKNLESSGVPYPKTQPMKIYGSIWSANGEAMGPTAGGHTKTDWTKAPFVAAYRNFDAAESCRLYSSDDIYNNNGKSSSCNGDSVPPPPWLSEEVDTATKERAKWVQNNYMIYSYCSDTERFPGGTLPPECDFI